jgi:hypothetical protein
MYYVWCFNYDEWKYIIIGRIFESEIILIPPSLKISESSSNGSYRNTDEVWWRYGISAQCLIEVIRSSGEEMWRVDAYQIPYYSRDIEGEKRTHPRFADWINLNKTDNVSARRISSKMATIDEFALKNIGLWWRYGISRHCDEWKYIIIGRIFESEIILIPPSLKISESARNQDNVTSGETCLSSDWYFIELAQ